MTDRLHKTKENLPPRKSQLDEFNIIRLKAQQASKFYNSVGLSNGDLPRNVTARESSVLWPASSEKKRSLDDITKPSATVSQPSTPSSTTSKYGATWLELSKPINNAVTTDLKSEDTASRYNALPNKFTPERSYKSVPSHYRSKSSSSQDKIPPLSPRTFCDSTASNKVNDDQSQAPVRPRKISFENNLSNPLNSCISLPRNPEQKQETIDSVFKKEEYNLHPANGLDVEQPPRVSSHLYEKQLSRTPERKPKTQNDQSEKLTPVFFGKKPSPSNRKTSNNDVGPVQQTNNYSSSNSASGDLLSPFRRQRSRSDSHRKAGTEQGINSNLYRSVQSRSPTSHLIEAHFGSSSSLNDGQEMTDDRMSGIVSEYRKNKSCQSSPVVKHSKKVGLFFLVLTVNLVG